MYLPAEDIFRARLDRADVLNNIGFQRHDQASIIATGGAPLYYSNGFLPAGAGQTSSAGGGGGLLSAITSGLETFLPSIWGARTPGIIPAGGPVVPRIPAATVPVAGIPGRVMGGVTRAASQHPVLTAAGGAAATVGGAVLARRMGHRVSVRADGTIHHHRRMNPCNIHALRRGLRRASAFERIARRVLHITSPKKHISGFKLPHRRKK